jgi:VWFA-related protein
MRRLPLVSVAAALFLLGAGPQAQQPGTQFRSGVTLVTIDVTVLDKDGRPVADLAAKDFEVKLNGRVQAIRTATFLQASAESEMSGAVGPTFDAVTPAVPVTGPARAAVTPRLFVVLVDDLSFAPQRGRALFAATERFVTSLPSTDRVGLTTTTGTTTINPATDRAPITATLKTITGNYSDPRSSTLNGPATGKFTGPDQSMGIAQALAIDRGDSGALEEALVRECFGGDRTAVQRQSLAQIIVENQCASALQNEGRRIAAVIKQTTEQQLRGYASVIRAMQPASGLKHLVLLTDGVGLTQDTERLGPVARAAAESGVQVSVLMEKADMSLSDQGRRDMDGKQTDVGSSQRRREDDAMFLNGAKTVADTVGAVFHNIVGTPDPFFERVRMAATAVYRLAVEAPDDTVPGKDFALAARVKREGLIVVANRRAVAASPAPVTAAAASPRFAEEAKKPLTVDEQLQRAIATGRAPRGLEITLARAVRRAEDPAQVVVDVSAEIPASSTGPFDTVLGIVDERGAIRTSKKQVEAPSGGGPNRLEFSVPLAPGSYKLRFAAADASGAVGVVESAVEARLTTMGAIATSELMRWTVNAEGEQRRVAGEQVPQDAKTLLVALELYPPGAAAPADLLVKIAMAPQGSDAVPNERIVTPELRDGALVAEAEYMLDRLTAGTYTIRATVLSGATPLGTVSTIVRR